MKIAVLNGSPKGMTSVTMQYILFLRKKLPEHEFQILNVCSDLRKLEQKEAEFREIIQTISESDGVLWAFPLYYMLVHAHYKRFIELIDERSVQAAFKDKYTAVLTTSIRFFDHTAHNYINAVSDDLGMRCVGSYSAEMYDLEKQEERTRLLAFADDFLRAIENGITTGRRNRPLDFDDFAYVPGNPSEAIRSDGKRIIIVTDAENPETNASKMVDRFQRCFDSGVEVVGLHDIKMRGGCMGCIQCGLDNVCVYQDADDVYETYKKLMDADVLVLAGSIKDRFLSSRWKLFFDRGFFNNHVPMFSGKQVCILISGPLMQIPNLRQVLEGYVECQRANLVDIVTDECGDSRELDQRIDGLAGRLMSHVATGYIGPPTFLSVGGGKIFRDEIWASLRLVFRADHRYYKRHGRYDFPKRSFKTRATDTMMSLLLRIPPFRREFRRRIKEEMIKPLQKILEDV